MSTFLPSAATQDERLTAVVVLPTPPFWFATATIFATLLASFREKDLFHMEHFEDEARRFPLRGPLIQPSIAHQRGFLNWFFIILRWEIQIQHLFFAFFEVKN